MQTASEQEWAELAEYLAGRSVEICADNGCTEEEHVCESYAYIAEDGTLSDICYPDYWQGWGSEDIENHGQCAAIPLPFDGTGDDLRESVESDIG